MNKSPSFGHVVLFALAGLLILAGCNQSDAVQEKSSQAAGKKTAMEREDHSSHDHSEEESATSSGMKCAVHNAPKEDCWICDVSLRDKNRLWCKEHNTYEDRCWKCHPELQDKSRLYCTEHGVYEDECILCHPELKSQSSAPAGEHNTLEKAVQAAAAGQETGKKSSKDLYCKEHRLLEKDCAICHPELLQGLQPGQGLKVRFPSAQSAQKAGLRVEPAKNVAGTRAASDGFLARVVYNRNQMTHIVPKTGGTVGKVLVDNGARVKKGQVLCYFSSPEAAEAKSTFLAALADSSLKAATFERERELVDQNVSSRRELEMAKAEYKHAQGTLEAALQRLSDLGLTSREISDLRREGKSSSTLVLRAPFEGTVVNREAVSGAAATAHEPLFTVVNLSHMWLEMSIPASIALQLQKGDRVAAHFPELGPGKIPGEITWIASEIEENTRMVKVRAEIPNPGGRLKRGLFGRAVLMSAAGSGEASEPGQAGVPQSALQRIDGKHYVFVPLEDDLFEARLVQVSGRENKNALVSGGLRPGEPVVVAGSFTVRSEMFKSRFGAGCVGH